MSFVLGSEGRIHAQALSLSSGNEISIRAQTLSLGSSSRSLVHTHSNHQA